MKEVVIVDATRTPIGKYRGELSSLSAVELGKTVVETILDRNKAVKNEIKQVIFGHVLQAGVGQNTARQIAIGAGLPVTVPAMTVNEVCGSGLKSVILARQLIQVGQAEVVLAGGTENMSQAPMIQQYQPETQDYAPAVSSMTLDGLTDAFSQASMGITAENVAAKYNVSRQEQDAFALQSQQRAAAATEQGKFVEEITPVKLPTGALFTQDEGIRGNSTLEKLGTLRTVFKEDGSVTAGTSSTVNDGAAAVLLASKEYAERENLSYLAVIKDYTEVGVDPAYMGFAPYNAITELLKKNQLTVDDIDLFEINEAFAATTVAAARELGLPNEKVNIYGGGISIGHPIGASGSRILTTLAYALKANKKKRGIASLCIGGGLGLAVLIERDDSEDSSDASEKKKFYQLSREERVAELLKENKITAEQKALLLDQVSLPEGLADNLIENQISEIETPLGIAQNFVINGQEKLIPMATEEPSVIAAASNAAKMVKQAGGFTATTSERLMRGQIVFSNVKEAEKLQSVLLDKQSEIFSLANNSYPSIVKRGGGIRKLDTRCFTEAEETYVSLDILVDVKDAMGANIVNTILEGIAQGLREWFPEEAILFSILSNFATESLVTARCKVPLKLVGNRTISGEEVAKRIAEASAYAKLDTYRAVTHNKGIMNGIDAVILATGNDNRAVAAACHAYAAKNGHYEGLTTWTIEDEYLVGELTVPMAIASVGGASGVLPKAKFALDLLGVDSAIELAEIVVSVGLAQNLAAVRALVTDGIQKGHMSLQVRSLAMSVGAQGEEIQLVVEALKKKGQMNKANAEEALREIRSK